MLLPNTDARAAVDIAERLRCTVAELRIRHAEMSAGVVTVSIGVAALEPARQDSQALVEAADAALYAAKRRGRNVVVAHSATRIALAG